MTPAYEPRIGDSLAAPAEQAVEEFEVDRLEKVMIDAGLAAALAIVFLPKAASADDEDVAQLRLGTQLLRDGVAVHPRHECAAQKWPWAPGAIVSIALPEKNWGRY